MGGQEEHAHAGGYCPFLVLQCNIGRDAREAMHDSIAQTRVWRKGEKSIRFDRFLGAET